MKFSSSIPVKRGWRGYVIAVLGLVILSMLVPLVFLLGLHNGFQSGYPREDRNSGSDDTFRSYDARDRGGTQNQSQDDQLGHLDDLMKRLRPSLSKDVLENFAKDASSGSVSGGSVASSAEPKSLHTPPVVLQPLSHPKGTVQVTENVQGVTDDETEKSCELEFGSYCLWCEEHKEDMKDSMVKKLKDQLFVARAYYPSIAKVHAQDKLSQELKQNIQEFERIFSEASTDADLPPHVEKKLQRMEAAIAKAKSFHVDCNNVDKKFRQLLDLTEDEAHFHMKQSAFIYQLAVQTMPKSLHCLLMRLTVEYFKSHVDNMEVSHADKHDDVAFHNYVIISKNVLAASVVINSTTMHVEESEKQVFHVITDGQNFFAMRHWFSRNFYKKAAVHVLNVEDLNVNYLDNMDPQYLSLSEEYRVSIRSVDKLSSGQMSTEYISVFGRMHFLLPEIFQNLKKVVVLDDDVVVQRDLSPLWSLDMKGKVNGAVEFCRVRFGQLKSYLGQNSFESSSCAWMSGLNMIDLERWRELKLTRTYQRLLQEHQSQSDVPLRATAALSASLLTFQNQIYALDSSWALSGLGHDYGVETKAIKKFAVLHYNGNMKPWLELGIPKYKRYWKKFLKRNDLFMGECNVNP